jgi:hypothetical protein
VVGKDTTHEIQRKTVRSGSVLFDAERLSETAFTYVADWKAVAGLASSPNAAAAATAAGLLDILMVLARYCDPTSTVVARLKQIIFSALIGSSFTNITKICVLVRLKPNRIVFFDRFHHGDDRHDGPWTSTILAV